jgi:hypothetical protein
VSSVPSRPQFALGTGIPCLVCGGSDRMTVRALDDERIGLCEACSVDAYWAWKRLQADAVPVPGDDGPTVARTVVLVTRLARVGEDLADPGVPESYEVALVVSPDGSFDLPGTDNSDDPVVGMALERAGMATWPSCEEELFVGYTPRGRLWRVCSVTAWTDASNLLTTTAHASPAEAKVAWRPWSEWEASWGAMAGFYAALRSVWTLRIWKHAAQGKKTSAPTVRVRRAAVEYMRLRRLQASDDAAADLSMLPLLRQQVGADEMVVVREVCGSEARREAVVSQEVAAAQDEQEDDVTDVEGEPVPDDGVDPLGEGGDE